MRYAVQNGKRRRVAALQRAAARGISLLEVLFAIGVLSIGLLGVAALIPVATFEMVETTKADRAAACGEAITHDLQVRGVLRPGDWRTADDSAVMIPRPNPGGPPPYEPRTGHRFGESYAVDSLYVSQTSKAERPSIDTFPYSPQPPGTWTRMQRVTWTKVGFDQRLSRSVFMWRDDQQFPISDDSTIRPEQLFQRDSANNPIKGDNKGDYTWMVTVTPSPEHIDFTDMAAFYTYPENAPLYDVSVVVFYKRNMNPPSAYAGAPAGDENVPGERQVVVKFLGGGLGGGDVELMIVPGQQVEYLQLRENDWLMVSGFYRRTCYFYDDIFTSSYVPAVTPVGVHKWYRVVAAGEIIVEWDEDGNGSFDPYEDYNGNGVQDPAYRNATLAGPDWNLGAWCTDLFDPDPLPQEGYATLMEGAIGVYTTTIELDL